MQILWIALKDLRIAARDRSGLLLQLAMPLVLITVLGVAFGGAFASRPVIPRFEVGVVDQDTGQLAETLWQILQDSQLQELFLPTAMEADRARELIKEGELAGAIVIPANFTTDVFAGKPTSLQIWCDPGQELRPIIIQTVAQSYVDNLLATQLVVSEALENGQTIAQHEIEALGQQIASEINKVRARLEIDVVTTGKQVDSFLYYAIGMACMFLLMSGSIGLQSIASEERRQTLSRIMATPTARVRFLLGKSLGQMGITVVQFVILYVVTSLIFKTDWGSPLAVLLLALAYAFAIAGLSMLVVALIPNRVAAANAWLISVQIMAALGGSMVPLSQFPPFMLKVACISPSFWGLRGFLDIAMAQPLPLVNMLVLAITGLVAITLGTWRLARG